MKFEVFDVSKLEKVKSDLKVASDPFLSEKNQKQLLKLQRLAKEKPEEYLELEGEMRSLKEPLAVASKHLNELSSGLKGLLDKVLDQQAVAENYNQEVTSMTDEIEELEDEYFNLPDSEEKEDELIGSAMRLLIEAKKHKFESFSSAFPEELESYKENIEDFYAQESEFKKASENLDMMKELAEENFKKIESITLKTKVRNKSRAKTVTVESPAKSSEVKPDETREEKEELSTQGLEAIIPSNVVKQNKYKKLLGK